VVAGPNVIGGGQLARHDCVKHRASFEIPRQCRREGFRALEHRLASPDGSPQRAGPLHRLDAVGVCPEREKIERRFEKAAGQSSCTREPDNLVQIVTTFGTACARPRA